MFSKKQKSYFKSLQHTNRYNLIQYVVPMKIDIKEVTSKKLLKTFIDLPWSIYKDDPNWVPPLKLTLQELFNPKHPVYSTCTITSWVAFDNSGNPIGRISAIVNSTFNNYYNKKSGHFGFFESIDNQEVTNSLFNTAEEYLKDKGMNTIVQ